MAKEMKITAPDVITQIEDQLPAHEINFLEGQSTAEVYCPRCRSDETGCYEVNVRRMHGVLAIDGSVFGESYGSVVDEDHMVSDKNNRTLWDCNNCGYRFTLTAAKEPSFLGEGI